MGGERLSPVAAYGGMSRLHPALTIAAALLAGFAGGLLSGGAAPVRAQEYAAHRDFTGSSFALMDPEGRKLGEFAVAPDGHAYLRFYDESGRVTWAANETRAYPVK